MGWMGSAARAQVLAAAERALGFEHLPLWSQRQRGRTRPAVHTRAHLAAFNSQIYEVNVAASKFSRPADACGDVENRNGGGEQDLGRESTTER
jgi:hypothetical protein